MDRTVHGMSDGWLAPCILLVLRGGDLRGGDLSRRVTELGFGPFRSWEFDRALREMEREGMISSIPELSGCWPPLQRYAITESGEAFLGFWADYLEERRAEATLFLGFYAGTTARVGSV